MAAAVTDGNQVASTNQRVTNVHRLLKTTGITLLRGGLAFWDHSANECTYRMVHDRDFYGGRVVEDAASNDTSVLVALNVDPRYDRDLARDPGVCLPVGTQAVGGFGYPRRLGGSMTFVLTATNEAQKVDLLAKDGFSKNANPIVEFAFAVTSDGAGTVVDASLGVASATHATDADAIAEHLLDASTPTRPTSTSCPRTAPPPWRRSTLPPTTSRGRPSGPRSGWTSGIRAT